MPVKAIVKSILPKPLLKALRRYRVRREARAYHDLTTLQIFTKIYQEHAWGKSSDQAQRFFSGSGSHQKEIVVAYTAAVQDFLSSLEKKPDVVDLGCGDF